MSSGITGAASAAPGSLAENEAIIERGLTSFVEVGQALTRIRDGRQYRGSHSTFEAYCNDRWQFTPQRAGQLIAAADVIETIETNVSTPPPTTESVARALKPLTKDSNMMAQAWKETVERHGPKPTAEQTRQVVREKAPPKAKAAKPKPKPKAKRKARGESTFPPGTTLAYDDEVLKWVRTRVRRGWTRQQIMDATKTGADGWPQPGRTISSERDFGEIRLAIYYIETAPEPKRQPTESGKRLRQLHTEKRNGRHGDLWNLQVAVSEAVGLLEWFDLPDLDWSEETEGLVIEIYDDLERHARWNDAALDAVTAHMDELGRQRKIKALHDRANDPSSTPSERATAARLADKLEQRRAAARLSS